MGLSDVSTEGLLLLSIIAITAVLMIYGFHMVTDEGTVIVQATKTNILQQGNSYTVLFSIKSISKYSEPLFLKEIRMIAYTENGVREITIISPNSYWTKAKVTVGGDNDIGRIQNGLANNRYVLNPGSEETILVAFNKLNEKIYGVVFQLEYETPSGKRVLFTSNDVSVLRTG